METARLAERFEEHRPRLRAVAYRMLGSLTEAEDAVQDAWLRVSRADTSEVENLGGRLTTVVARVCLNVLRSRRARHEQFVGLGLPDPIVSPDGEVLPEEQMLLADSVGLALLVLLDTLGPAERLAFVLHDVFDFPFEEIAPIVGRTPTAARQLASRARRRVRDAGLPPPEADRSRQREVVDAFFSAAHRGDLAGLMAVLDPEVVLRRDLGSRRAPMAALIRGAADVARGALQGGAFSNARLHPVLVNGLAGVVVTLGGRPFSVIGFVVSGGRIVEIDAIGDPDRVRRVTASVLAPDV